MSAPDMAAKARARMDQVRREMAERRSLRSRNGNAARERARESLMKQGPVAEQVAKHLGELGRRRRQAGGWATDKTERDKDYIMGFGGEEEQGEQFAFRRSSRPDDEESDGLGAIEDEDVDEPKPTPPAPEAPAARQPRRPVPVHDDVDDDEYFSNPSSWIRNE